MLVQEGLVEVRQGSGTRVLNHKAIQNYNKVTSVTESLMKKGYRVTTSDMMIDIISADKQLADELEIPEEPAWRGFSGCSLRMKSLLR